MKFVVKAEAELRHIRLEKDKYQSEYTRKVEHVGGDFDKLTVSLTKTNTNCMIIIMGVFQLEISQLTTERDQLVRQLEKSQDMLLSFQQVGRENNRLFLNHWKFWRPQPANILVDIVL